ncbi:hypothetical protein EC973_004763 [Apophysomyces ossiformis]|uniref:ER-bound oxygenase mpaB/mpaB'/Rubber oxygenase catalytic domain-containing protein n=1 Tax=Apophysomyces ossiformis TaxID=679940 RepID=A0A8H7BUV2_9FUNG|nr:hypothetical protein EC973_004763 [Apophysomyces ossiformis]
MTLFNPLVWLFSGRNGLSTLVAVCAIFYVSLVRYYRFRWVNSLRLKYPDPNVVLKDKKLALEIYSHTFRREFPSLARESLEFALFKTFVLPTVSKLLVSTGEFRRAARRRAEDTELILSELIDAYPRMANYSRYASEDITPEEAEKQHARADQSLARLNELHGKYPILNGDYLYTLALFLSEPIRWINTYEWRQLDIREINAIFHVWHDIGVGMKIQDVPDTKEELLRFKEEYAKEHRKYHPANWQCAKPTIELLLERVPKPLHPIVYRTLPCLLEKEDILAFGIDPPSRITQTAFNIMVMLRAKFIRYLCLPRRDFLIRTPFHPDKNGKYVPLYHLYKPVYADGYRIAELGPEKFLPKCPVTH